MSRTLASCKYIYTEDTYREYYKLRENQNKTYRGLYIAGAVLFGILAAISFYSFFTGGGTTMLLLAIVCLVFVVLFVFVLKKPIAKPDRNNMRDFFKRHGADVDQAGRQWAFRECVEVTDEGITVAFGPVGCPDSDLLPVFKPWSQWETVASSDKVIAVLCVNDVKMGAAFWLGGSAMQTARLMQVQHERDEYEDAVLPLDRLDDQNADEVVQIIKQHIGK